jgi:hypothetical protein
LTSALALFLPCSYSIIASKCIRLGAKIASYNQVYFLSVPALQILICCKLLLPWSFWFLRLLQLVTLFGILWLVVGLSLNKQRASLRERKWFVGFTFVKCLTLKSVGVAWQDHECWQENGKDCRRKDHCISWLIYCKNALKDALSSMLTILAPFWHLTQCSNFDRSHRWSWTRI